MKYCVSNLTLFIMLQMYNVNLQINLGLRIKCMPEHECFI